MEKFRLRRQNRRIIAGFGVKVASATNKGRTDDPDKWEKVQVFTTEKNPYVVGIVCYSNYDEGDFYAAHRCKTLERVLGWVRLECPTLLAEVTSQLKP